MTFTKSNARNCNGTSMIEIIDLNVTESDLIKVFGSATVDNTEIGRGYGFEWYFVSSTGSVYGVGFRYGIMRTRAGFSYTEEEYNHFLNWLKDQLK